jgi:hypothetical protein
MIDIREHGGQFGGKKEPQYTFERKYPTIDVRTPGTVSQYYSGSGNICNSFAQRHTDFQAHLINNNASVYIFSHDFIKTIASVIATPFQVFVTSERNIIVSYNGSRNWMYLLASENYLTSRDIENTKISFGWASYVFEYGNLVVFVEWGNSKKVIAINKLTWSLAWYADFAQMTSNDIKGAFVYDKYLFIVSEQKKFYKIDMTMGTIVSTHVMTTTGLFLIGNIGAFDGQYFYLIGRSGSSYSNTPHKIHKFDTAGNLISTITFDYSNIGVNNIYCGYGYTLDFVKNKYLIFTTGYDIYGSTILVVDITTAKVITGWAFYSGSNYLFGQIAISTVVAGSGLCVKNLIHSSTWFKWGEA